MTNFKVYASYVQTGDVTYHDPEFQVSQEDLDQGAYDSTSYDNWFSNFDFDDPPFWDREYPTREDAEYAARVQLKSYLGPDPFGVGVMLWVDLA